MSDQLLVAPLAEPIHLDEAKAHLRVTTTAEDALVKRAIRAARRQVEEHCARAIVRQQRTHLRDAFPSCYPYAFELGYGPVRAVQSVQYVDTEGATQTLDASLYRVDVAAGLARLTPAYGEVWPSTQDVTNAVIVTYTAGHVVPIASMDATGDTLTAKGHDLAADDPIRLSNSGGAPGGGLSVDAAYYVKSPTADTLQLATSVGGSAVDISAAADSGQSFVGQVPDDMVHAILLLVGHFYANREATVASAIPPQELPLGVEALLAPYRLIRF